MGGGRDERARDRADRSRRRLRGGDARQLHGDCDVGRADDQARESVFGLDLASGKLLWRYTAPASPNANCCTPIIDGDQVFASSSYGTGGGLAQTLETGWLVQGGGRSLFYNSNCTSACIIDLGLGNIWNHGNGHFSSASGSSVWFV